jgi:hypothetical protein
VSGEGSGGPQHGVHEGGLPMVDMGHERDVSQLDHVVTLS